MQCRSRSQPAVQESARKCRRRIRNDLLKALFSYFRSGIAESVPYEAEFVDIIARETLEAFIW